MTELSRRTFLQVTGATGVVAASGLGQASAAYSAESIAAANGRAASITVTGDTIRAANDVVRVAMRFAAGSLNLTSLFNVAAKTEYQTVAAGGQLFSYELDGVATVAADDGGWTFGQPEISPITMFTRQGERTVGRQVRIPMSRTAPRAFTVTVVLEVYNGRAGVRFYTLVRNGSATDTLTITSSVVLALGFANLPHTLHYVPNAIWKSTRGGLAPVPEDTSTPSKRAELPKKAVSVYDAGHGWSFSPELNWKTLKGKGNVTVDYMLPPFASLDVWSGTDHVRLITNPSALQLVLFPNEEFEYLSVNVTVFVGGLVDGKMAEQVHFRARFRYNNIITLMHTNDFDYRAGPSRELPPDYYYTTIIPKALAAGLDMVMLDDLWNTTRDSIEPSDAMKLSIHSLGEFSQTLTDRGLLFGLWFSLSGGGHVAGRDLADPAMLAFKRGQIETLINDFHLTHQMIDLTEYWQNEAVTEYSHPSDNVYRKAVLSRRLMNDLVAQHPHLLPKMTTELDIFPTQGDRNNGLMHVCNNGWNTANGGVTGESLSLRTALTGFGHLPMESAYMNGGTMSGRMEDYYSYLAVRTVKFPQDPGNAAQWPPAAITLMATFNTWRRSPRVRDLTEELFRPVYFGPGWDTSAWDSSVGPYVWMFTDTGRTKALVLATGAGGQASGASVNLRWLDNAATYMIGDITLDDSGGHSYAYRGSATGAALKSAGFPIDLRANASRGKAFWISRVFRPGAQVVYADENVGRWIGFVVKGVLNVVLTGTANSTATLVIGDPTTNRGLVRSVKINASGLATLKVATADLVPPQPVGAFFADPVLVQAELVDRTLTPATVTATMVNEGNASNGSWIRADFTAAGQRIEFTVDVPADGSYEIRARFKENASRGRSQPFLDGEPLGPGIDHQYPGRVYRGVEFRERVLGVRTLTAGRHAFAFASTGTSGTSLSVGVDYLKLTPTLDTDRLVFEAEAASVGSSVPLTSTAETAASPSGGGAFQVLPATGTDDWVDYQVTAPKAGHYRLTSMVKKAAARGQFQVQSGGAPLGNVVDLYLPTGDGDYQYLEVDHGTLVFDEAGSRTLRYAVVGRNAASTSWQLGIDYLVLTPVGQVTLSGPPTVRVGKRVQLHVGFVDVAQYTAKQHVLWSVEGADTGAAAYVDDAGMVTGRRAGTAVVRVRSLVDRSVTATMTITVS